MILLHRYYFTVFTVLILIQFLFVNVAVRQEKID